MDIPPSGSDELFAFDAELVSITIKASGRKNLYESDNNAGDSLFRIVSKDRFECLIYGKEPKGTVLPETGRHIAEYQVCPLFFEEKNYEVIIEPKEGHRAEFWHDNLNVRSKVTENRNHSLSGIISFDGNIGYSDLEILVDGEEYVTLTVEVYPSKISYKDDYRAIVEDITTEIYSLIFDFLKKTYQDYGQSDRISSSPVEFFAVLRKIYKLFLQAADMILAQPHHVLNTTHTLLRGYKIKRIDGMGLRWLAKHPEHAHRISDGFAVDKALAVKKQVTYDTKENRLVKHILTSVVQKLKRFRRNYVRLDRKTDDHIVKQIDTMMREVQRRLSEGVLTEVGAMDGQAGFSLVFTMASGYRDLYKYYLMLLRGLSVTGDVFHVSVKDMHRLYEYWCFIKLNSLMKDKYEFVSQDVIKTRGNGLFVSLDTGSSVKYRHGDTLELITLSYNPTFDDSPTGSQRPDNVLSLKKKESGNSDEDYEYVFDAKYRINPALEGTYYYKHICKTPGPEVDDINTMHRYRDAIVYQKNLSPYRRNMFGAYVLFPYNNEQEYMQHKFYDSISKVNIGGLPFLPSTTGLVTRMLDELIEESGESAFERASLPVGVEQRLASVDWDQKDVLVGLVRDKEQFEMAVKYRFYHIPCDQVNDNDLPIHTIALYRSQKAFGADSGVRYYGEVVSCSRVRRCDISELPSDSQKEYYRFDVREWKTLQNPIAVKEVRISSCILTNWFLLEHSREMPELKLRSEEEYRLYYELKRAFDSVEINEEDVDAGFVYGDATVIFEGGKINIYEDGKIVDQFPIDLFRRNRGSVFRNIKDAILRCRAAGDRPMYHVAERE